MESHSILEVIVTLVVAIWAALKGHTMYKYRIKHEDRRNPGNGGNGAAMRTIVRDELRMIVENCTEIRDFQKEIYKAILELPGKLSRG